MRRAAFRYISILTCLVLLCGCGGGSGADDATPTTAARPTRVATVVPMTLGDVVWTTAVDPETGAPTSEVASYTSDTDTIIAAVEATDVPAGTVFTATWTINGMDVPDAKMTVEVSGQMDSAWVTFAFKRNQDRYFPVGMLEVTVSAPGIDTVSGEIEITIPGQ